MRRFIHLEAAMRYKSNGGSQCVQRAVALALDLPNSVLVFGVNRAATFEERLATPGASQVPFIHAWVEVGEDLYAPTLIERLGQLRPFPREFYYTVNGVTKTWHLERSAFNAIAKRFGLSAAFKHFKPRAGSEQVTDALLCAAGVKYVLSDRRTLLPADDTDSQ